MRSDSSRCSLCVVSQLAPSTLKANFCLVMISAESMSYPETQLFIEIG